MEEGQRKFLSLQLKLSQEWQDRFFEYRQNTRVQLLSNQLQNFQSIAGISLAVIAALLTTGSVDISLWWIMTGLAALLLVLFSVSYTREMNDSWDNGLNREEKSLTKIHEELEAVILKAVKEDDYSIYENHVLSKGKPEPIVPVSSYAGEIAVFLFLTTLFFGILAIVDQYVFIPICVSILITLSGLLLCFAGSMADWNLKLTDRVSAILERVLKKPI